MSPIWLPLVGNSHDHPDRASNRRFLGKSLSVHWLAVSRRTPSAPGSKLFQEGDQGVGGYPSQPADLDGLNSARADKGVHDGSAEPETLGCLLNRQHQGQRRRQRIGSRRKKLVEVIASHHQPVLSLRWYRWAGFVLPS
jgi:hypothetical protein